MSSVTPSYCPFSNAEHLPHTAVETEAHEQEFAVGSHELMEGNRVWPEGIRCRPQCAGRVSCGDTAVADPVSSPTTLSTLFGWRRALVFPLSHK